MRACRPRLLFALLTAVLLAPAPHGPVRADADLRSLARTDLLEPIALARIAEEAGDALLLSQLREASDRELALIAVRASPYASAPERLVPALAALACGRDPVLAPEAALSLRALGERLHGAELAAREALESELREAIEALACATRAPAPRADIAVSLATLAAELEAL